MHPSMEINYITYLIVTDLEYNLDPYLRDLLNSFFEFTESKFPIMVM